jgi:hypothetical protein
MANRLLLSRTLTERTTYAYDAVGNQTLINADTDLVTTTWDAERGRRVQHEGGKLFCGGDAGAYAARLPGD